ncbi:hypothetical protein GCM10010284_41100 [Streptomyces rubiginosohelvolus]|uniref:Uncharacterized protein n=1 Tax=Streptomyces rubiginosohelvolus TaxID=67362 RepID=A0ABQ3BW14_9ACTN|nr:hypothetical protein GCM10010284_41100 [Streptomyces rubiginosohelvolus]GGZ54371.1 hypothetical protein GCM10010328_31220 [Streptomyces pluricolorescens]
MRMERHPRVQQPLRLRERLRRGADDPLRLPFDARCPVRQGTAKSVTGARIARPALGITVSARLVHYSIVPRTCKESCEPCRRAPAHD